MKQYSLIDVLRMNYSGWLNLTHFVTLVVLQSSHPNAEACTVGFQQNIECCRYLVEPQQKRSHQPNLRTILICLGEQRHIEAQRNVVYLLTGSSVQHGLSTSQCLLFRCYTEQKLRLGKGWRCVMYAGNWGFRSILTITRGRREQGVRLNRFLPANVATTDQSYTVLWTGISLVGQSNFFRSYLCSIHTKTT